MEGADPAWIVVSRSGQNWVNSFLDRNERVDSKCEIYSFSPESKQIASKSEDNTIRVWNADSGEVVLGPFEGHTNSITSGAFSPDGKHIVLGSDNTMRCMWNSDSIDIVSAPFLGEASQ